MNGDIRDIASVEAYVDAEMLSFIVPLALAYATPAGYLVLTLLTSVETVHPHSALRENREALARATEACVAVLRLFDSAEPNVPAYNLLCHELALLDSSPAAATQAQALAFRLKLLLAAGFAPQLAACASCGEREHLVGFSGAAGGVVCAACEASMP